MTELCQACWDGEKVPEQWHESRVAALFKKGDPAECSNYRPVCLTAVGYKIFASILLSRLKMAGADSKIWRTQFGFRKGYGTADALFAVRRLLEDAWASKEGKMNFIALDWAKAFDSISPKALQSALLRFGVSTKFAKVVESIYQSRTFDVRGGRETSASRPQQYGISQGCPLSPFLFSIVMTVLLHDAKSLFAERGLGPFSQRLPMNELVYADDTLVFDTEPQKAEDYMNCIKDIAAEYGLTFNVGKLEAMPVRTSAAISNGQGGVINTKNSIRYLGSLISNDGRMSSELGARIGGATAEFETLRRIWGHCSLTRAKRVQIFRACVESRLLYALHSGVLNVAERRRLDGFQARCLRRIMGISPSFVSRISNAAVLKSAGCKPCSIILRERQAKYVGTLRERPVHDPCRQLVFQSDGHFRGFCGPRRVGRPRITWLDQVIGWTGHS